MFQLLVLNEPAFFGVHQKHLSGTEPVLLHHLGLVHPDGSHLGGQNHVAVLGNIVPGGAQAIAVQNRSHHVAVGKEDGGGAVPGLHHSGVVSVEILNLPIHVLVVLPGGRDGDHHRQGQIHTAHDHKLQGIVQHGGVGTLLVDNGKNLVHLILKIVGLHILFPGDHLVHISPDGINLSVVDDETVGVSPHPAGIGVGAET